MSCTPDQSCGQCGYCVAIEYERKVGTCYSRDLLHDIAERAIAKSRAAGAEWMREQAAKQLEVLHLTPAIIGDSYYNRQVGSNLAVKNGAKLIRVLPLAPGGDET